MIAAIRVRFTPTPASQMWSDAVFGNWLNPMMQYSLGHYWLKSSFTLADLTFQIFPPIVIDDPRLVLTPAEMAINEIRRKTLVDGVTAKVTAEFKPDWDSFDGMLIWFAQPTDLFGGGAFSVPLPAPFPMPEPWAVLFTGPQRYKDLPVAVSDIASPFDMVCQELGHAYGFQHPLGRYRSDYGDPYDSMASQRYGEVYTSSFERPDDPALPVGQGKAGADVQRTIRPYLSAAQLAISPFAPTLRAAGMFVDVPPSYATGASSFTLHALDDAIARFPGQPLTIAAVIPPDWGGGDTYFLELRRSEGYDSGLRKNAADTARPPVGVVIHSHDKARNLILYHDTLPLADNRGDRDYHVFGGGGFTFRVTSIGADYRSVGITIGGRDFWRHFGVNIDDVQHEVFKTSQTERKKAEVSPCFMFPVGEYYYYYKYNYNRYTFVVSSFGYEQPGYVWTINGTVLDPSAVSGGAAVALPSPVAPVLPNVAKVSASVQSPGPTGKTAATKVVPIEYDIGPDRLSIYCDPGVGNVSLVVEVKSVETSPGVLKNFYEDRTIVTSVNFENVALEWDDNYRNRQKECEDAIDDVNRKHIPQRKFGVPKPGDPFRGRSIDTLINQLGEATLSIANAVVDELASVANTIKEQFSKRR